MSTKLSLSVVASQASSPQSRETNRTTSRADSSSRGARQAGSTPMLLPRTGSQPTTTAASALPARIAAAFETPKYPIRIGNSEGKGFKSTIGFLKDGSGLVACAYTVILEVDDLNPCGIPQPRITLAQGKSGRSSGQVSRSSPQLKTTYDNGNRGCLDLSHISRLLCHSICRTGWKSIGRKLRYLLIQAPSYLVSIYLLNQLGYEFIKRNQNLQGHANSYLGTWRVCSPL